MFKDFIERLATKLKEPLPGEKAQLQMGSDIRMKEFKFMPMTENSKNSGVMILLYPYKNTIYSVLILRPKYNGTHSGQISFPGGKFEDTDEDLERTALRETSEEIGVDISKVIVLGKLSKLYIPPSNYVVYPTVGYINEKPVFIADANEVKEIIEYPIEILLKKETIKTKQFKVNENLKFTAPYFDINGHVVWGATAMILSEFIEILRKIKIP